MVRKDFTLRQAAQQLGVKITPQEADKHSRPHTVSTKVTEKTLILYRCPECAGPMKVIERLSAPEIQLRSPPALAVAA